MNIQHNLPGNSERLFSPSDAASGLHVPASTLRLYSVKFSTLLSDYAQPRDPRSGRRGRRRYTADDLEVLARARDLVRSGRSFKEAIIAMGGTPVEEDSAGRHKDRADSPTGASTPAENRSAATNEQAIQATKQVLDSATEGWRALAAQKGEEIDRLRREVQTLEWELREIRRPWWQRLFSGD